MNKTYLFISDIHLGLQSREIEKTKERKLVEFLNFAKNNCDELFIAGDLFDYWFEYRRVYQKGFFRTLTALQDLTEAGVKVHYFIGNHDFFHNGFFEKEIGLTLYQNPSEFRLNEQRFFIGHGDGLVKNDFGYNILKIILRSRFTQFLYSLIHPDIGVALASHTSKSSRDYTSKKDYGEEDGLFEAAKRKIEEGYDFVLFGHLHRKQFLKYKNGYYINLGSWISEPCYGKFTDKFEIIDIK
ncbi:MAG: UDP-2,3-diacylglucosamine hydrolase [Ignavibacteriaceae bacterium]|uniref:UDP-2,3-diacylglucosamine diphosphatase n=1 Tax=Ignavibacterium TaxID=795750 RepID=UPI002080EE8A|nr:MULTISPECIES: UDP-2,3-diacylglucosamine diphosphatase [Ignavibacterium]MBI5662096.1 UDP-2,3-diacylglucosamine diphosphatase [Ignavibacterium album]GJQ44189.1 MAG: UDP-2,3-diacylglucosamine hydrolase [Ignavibacteriaceae bacterium]